jgi:phosphoribosyl-AMP cyclohydrolase
MAEIASTISQRLESGELIAAIAQDFETNEVLMLAWMNLESFSKSVESKQATYWSRSRDSLWRKGESSGNFQEIQAIYYDCDSDAILLKVKQIGVACHTGERSCFHNLVELT